MGRSGPTSRIKSPDEHFIRETIGPAAGLALILNSAELPSPLQFLSETSQWDDARRIYRRVCMLRATGKIHEAAELENTEFARALAAARIASNNGDEEAAVLAAEAERVTSACVLAELLAPLLAERLRAAPVTAAAPETLEAPAIREREKPAAPAPVRPTSEKVPSIADLIDGMLSQETFPARP